MTSSRYRLAVLVGSVRDGRFGPTVADWFAGVAAAHPDFEVEVLDLREHALPLVMPVPGEVPEPPVASAHRRLGAKLAAADAFVVVTPEYNHAPPAALKNTIDWYFDEWAAKPVAFVSYGGVGAGLRAVEQLRQIFAELHTVSVRESLAFANVWDVFAGGRPRDVASDAAAKVMLDRLSWWTGALHAARARHPFER